MLQATTTACIPGLSDRPIQINVCNMGTHIGKGFAVLAGLWLLASSALGLEKPISSHAKERFCLEEYQAATPWVQWASGERARCNAETSPSVRQECFTDLRLKLQNMEIEYAMVYEAQMQALKPEHPVRQALVQRLKERSDLAKVAMDGRMEPQQILSNLHAACMR